MRILVDHSGYDLLNLGDVAMLQGCLARLRHQWPDGEIRVIAHAPERLSAYCPGAVAIGRTFADSPYVRILPRKARLASEQLWRIAGPQFKPSAGREHPSDLVPRTAIEAVHWADVVVAAGGGYLTDTWWWHAAGVLSLLDLAQSLGKPTAMFGQGIGPLHGRALRAMARKVLPRLAVLGLREQVTGLGIALSLGTPDDVIRVTGDDAIEVIPRNTSVSVATALGVNVRKAGYAGVGDDVAASVGDSLVAIAREVGAPMIGLPVSRYPRTSDLGAIRDCVRAATSTDVTLADLSSPDKLLHAVTRCRVVVTGSYHAAVYALAQGVPAVCLTRSSYYDAKFDGLNAQFPEACQVIALAAQDSSRLLRTAIMRAWDLPPEARSTAEQAAQRLRAAGQEAYADFRAAVDNANAAPSHAWRQAQ